MSLKKKVEKLEKTIGCENDLGGARVAVMFGLQFGIFPKTIDFEKTVQAFASEKISLGKIIEEIHRKSKGLPKLPSEEKD